MTTQILTRKTCRRCSERKLFSCFTKRKVSKDGINSLCKACGAIEKNSYRCTRAGVIEVIYGSHWSSSKKRGHAAPAYTLQEFREWCYANVDFDRLYLNWINSGCNKMKKPSVDRKDDYNGYFFDNLLRVCTWQENFDRGHKDRKNGTNNKQSKAVIQMAKNGDIIKNHHSIHSAGRLTGVDFKNISSCCRGKLKSAGGYRWSYPNEEA